MAGGGSVEVLVLFGSNVDAEANSRAARERLTAVLKSPRFSSVYRSPAVGAPDSDPFLNWAVRGSTDLGPYELKFDVLRAIEADLGRVRSRDPNAPRTVDLDLALYGDLTVVDFNAGLRVPDPSLLREAHCLIPSREIAADWIEPTAGVALGKAPIPAPNDVERLAAHL